MQLPPIQITPIVIPATEEKVFDSGFITNLSVSASPNEQALLFLRVVPKNSSGEFSDRGIETYNLDLWECVANVPEAAAAMAAVINAVVPIREYANNRN